MRSLKGPDNKEYKILRIEEKIVDNIKIRKIKVRSWSNSEDYWFEYDTIYQTFIKDSWHYLCHKGSNFSYYNGDSIIYINNPGNYAKREKRIEFIVNADEDYIVKIIKNGYHNPTEFITDKSLLEFNNFTDLKIYINEQFNFSLR